MCLGCGGGPRGSSIGECELLRSQEHVRVWSLLSLASEDLSFAVGDTGPWYQFQMPHAPRQKARITISFNHKKDTFRGFCVAHIPSSNLFSSGSYSLIHSFLSSPPSKMVRHNCSILQTCRIFCVQIRILTLPDKLRYKTCIQATFSRLHARFHELY